MSEIERVTSTEVVVMTPVEIEVQAAVTQIRAGLTDLYEGLARFVTVEGWKVLGFNSFRKWAAEEMAMSLRSADLHLRKTKRLMELSSVLGKTINELAPTISLRSGHRNPVKSPLANQMKLASRKLSTVPALTNPDERKAAMQLRDHLTRLLGD